MVGDGLMLSDEAIDQALDNHCDTCGMNPRLECVDLSSGLPLSDVTGVPVHDRRVGDQ